MLFGLGIDLEQLYELKEDISDLNASIEAYQQASQLSPHSHLDQSVLLSRLGVNFRRRFEKSGDRSDIENGIQAAREAISRAQPDTSRTHYTINLALGLGERYEAYKKLEDLDEAIELGRQAVASTKDGDRERVSCLCGHSDNLYRRFNYTHRLEDLEETVALSRQVVDATTADDLQQSSVSNNLGSYLLHLYALTQEPATLNKSIALFRGIVDNTPAERQARATYLANLGDGLLRRYQLQETMKDLEEAITILRAALTTFPEDSKNRRAVSRNLSEGLKYVYIKTRNNNDRQAIAEATLQLYNLDRKMLLGDLYDITGDLAYLKVAFEKPRGCWTIRQLMIRSGPKCYPIIAGCSVNTLTLQGIKRA